MKATRYEVVVWLRGDGSFDPAYQGSDHNLVRATLSFTGQSTSADDGAPTAEPPVAALGSGRPMPSGYPFPESTMPVEIVVSWLPGGNGKSSRTFPLRVRSDGTSVQAFESVSRTWVTVPYVNRGGLLVFSAKRLRELGLEADPLGSALPPPDSLNWLYYP